MCLQQQLSRLALLKVQEQLSKAMAMNSRWLAELDVVISLVCTIHLLELASESSEGIHPICRAQCVQSITLCGPC